MKKKRILVVFVVLILTLVVAVIFHPRTLKSVLPMKICSSQDFHCTIHPLMTKQYLTFSKEDLNLDDFAVLDKIWVLGPLPEKNVIVNGKELLLFCSVKQKEESDYLSLPTIRYIVEDGKRYFINIGETAYFVISGEDLLTDLMSQLQTVSKLEIVNP